MLEFLKNSQDPIKAEELHLRGGVGLAAPQLDISKRIIAVHVPSADPEVDSSISFPKEISSSLNGRETSSATSRKVGFPSRMISSIVIMEYVPLS
jgi:peptide deformylase